jgi:aconitate decarboxylase
MFMGAYTRQIAELAAGLKLAHVPPEVIARAKGIVLDGLGCALYGSNVPWTRIMAQVIQRLEPSGGRASLWGRRETASATNAALINGTMVQGYELDDAHFGGSIHSGSIVLPAALAAAEYVGTDKVSGDLLMLAIIAGFEVGPRIGMCMNGARMTVHGWHSGAIVAPFPAAVAAGIVLGLDAGRMFHALGIAGTQACGLMAAQYGSMVKRMQHGKGAQSGVYAALLAEQGFTGIENIFEEPYGGYCTTFNHGDEGLDMPALSVGLGSTWETLRYTIKPYACRAGNQSAVDAVGDVMKETGVQAGEVDEIIVHVTEGLVRKGGWTYVPKGLTAAQMNTGFCVALRLIEGDVFVDQMVEANVARPDLVALAHRVKVVRDVDRERMGDEYRRGSTVEVRLNNGRVLRKTVDFCRGSPQRPLSGHEMAAKFRRLAATALAASKVAQIEDLVWKLDRLTSVSLLVAALRGE